MTENDMERELTEIVVGLNTDGNSRFANLRWISSDHKYMVSGEFRHSEQGTTRSFIAMYGDGFRTFPGGKADSFDEVKDRLVRWATIGYQ